MTQRSRSEAERPGHGSTDPPPSQPPATLARDANLPVEVPAGSKAEAARSDSDLPAARQAGLLID
jgi:hypothetical protein